MSFIEYYYALYTSLECKVGMQNEHHIAIGLTPGTVYIRS